MNEELLWARIVSADLCKDWSQCLLLIYKHWWWVRCLPFDESHAYVCIDLKHRKFHNDQSETMIVFPIYQCEWFKNRIGRMLREWNQCSQRQYLRCTHRRTTCALAQAVDKAKLSLYIYRIGHHIGHCFMIYHQISLFFSWAESETRGMNSGWNEAEQQARLIAPYAWGMD